jgi:hypothetical protein
MPINQALLPEFDMEMANTRKHLERVPDDKLDWAPHQKSMKMGRLAGHLAEIPTWVGTTINTESLDLAPAGGSSYVPLKVTSHEQALEAFDNADSS